MKLRLLLCSAVLFLAGCSVSDTSTPELELSDFGVKKTICSIRQDVVDMFTHTPAKQPVCEGSIVKGCQPVLYFDLGSTELSDEAIQNLDWASSKVLRYDRYNVNLTGHTDQLGDEEDNLLLSEKRANAVQTYLLEKGIDETRIHVSFKGEEDPVCEEDFCDELNRRVEMNIYPVDGLFSNSDNF